MGYGLGAVVRGAVDGSNEARRQIEDQVDRGENRKVRALQRERLEGQVSDETEVRQRRKAYEGDETITGAVDPVDYYKARRDKALKMGDTAEYERSNAKMTEAELKRFTKGFDNAMRRFIGTEGADYGALVDVYNKNWGDGNTMDMVRNEDGTYDITVTREGSDPVTHKAPNWEAVGKTAMRMGDPKAWMAMKDAEAKEELKRKTERDKIEAKGEQDRKTVEVRGNEARKTAVLRAGKGGKGVAGDPAAVRTAKWQIQQLMKNGKSEEEATQIVLKADKGDVTAKDKLRHLGALRRNAMPGDEGNVEGQLEKDVATAGGKKATRVKFDSQGNEITE